MKDSTTPTQARPSCFAHRHMTGNEYAIYDLARSKSRKTGILILSSRRMANEFIGMSKTTANDTALSLVSKGWFDPVAPRSDGKPTGIEARYRVLTHAQWIAKYPDKQASECRSNKEPLSAYRDTSVRSEGHSGLEEVSATDTEVSEIQGVVSGIQGEVSGAKHVTVTNEEGKTHQPLLTSIRQPLQTPLQANLYPPGSENLNVCLSSGGQDGTQVGTSSAPELVPPKRLADVVQPMPVPGKFPVPPPSVNLYVNASHDQYYASGSNEPVPLAEAWRQMKEVRQ